MTFAANCFIVIVAAIHLGFAYKEFVGRNSPKFYAKFDVLLGFDQDPRQIGRIVANAAVFNALLGVGLIASLWIPGWINWLQVYLLSSIIVAGIVGGITLKWWVAAAQCGPAAVALALVLLASQVVRSPGGF